MRVMSASVKNFGSYKELNLDFTNRGLTLISGPTGSGKSTLCDVVPWVLFGRTAKNGAADEIRSWNSEEPTIGHVWFADGFQVTRIRGKAKDNDLSFAQENDTGTASIQRGKDIPDTQRLINNLLGMDADLYLSGAYFHEFSQAAQFFTTSAKNRRQITEQMADLNLVKTLNTNLTEYKKEVKKAKDDSARLIEKHKTGITYLESSITSTQQKRDAWFANQKLKIRELELKDIGFETDKKDAIARLKTEHSNKLIRLDYDLDALRKTLELDKTFAKKQARLLDQLAELGNGHCDACGAPTEVQKRMVIQKALHTLESERADNERTKIAITQMEQRVDKHIASLENVLNAEVIRPNVYGEQLKALRKESNPHSYKELSHQLYEVQSALVDDEAQFKALAIELSDLELLNDLTDDFRTACLKNTIKTLETKANQLLTTYFDAEIKVQFDIEGADKLDVSIAKDGNACSYTQLSKGQRQLLKLCFGVAVMESVSNFQGIHFHQVFLDEALDGLDDVMKSKAFKLLENLSLNHESVFCIDHSSEIKLLFANRLVVQNHNGESSVDES